MADNSRPPEGGSSFFDKIKDVLFEPEPAPRSAAPAARPAAPSAAAPTSAAAGPQAGEPASALGELAAKNLMVDRMMEVVMEKTTAYTALVEAVTPLEAFIPDEASRYKAAFGIVGKTRTVEQIVQSIDMQHLPALEAESQRFHGQAKGQQDLQINARIRDIAALRTTLASADDERKRLEARLLQIQQESAAANEKIAGFDREIVAKRTEMANINSQFEKALVIVKDRLVEARGKVTRYLGS